MHSKSGASKVNEAAYQPGRHRWYGSVPWFGGRIPATILSILSCVVACLMFVSLVFLGLIIPQGAALLSVAMLLLVVYMTTWD